MTKLSIIIPAYNAEPYIHELLDCLEKQLIFRTDVQVIVIDDGSTPPLKINRKWVEFYKNTKNKGISYTRNKGLKKAKGDLDFSISRLDKWTNGDYITFSVINVFHSPGSLFETRQNGSKERSRT